MKRTLMCVLSFVLILCLCSGCDSNNFSTTDKNIDKNINKNRELFNNINLSDYVTLSNYKGVRVTTASDDYTYLYDQVVSGDVKRYSLYKDSGTVVKGDTVNIDFKGYINGIAFEGGESQEYFLKIGSGSFIDGFEEQLIGMSTGEVRNINVTFPDDYGSTELAGKDAMFTVTVNGIVAPTEESYADAGFANSQEYIDDLNERAAKNYIINTVVSATEIVSYPSDDVEKISDELYQVIQQQLEAYSMDKDEYFKRLGVTEEEYKSKYIASDAQGIINNALVFYSILEKENLTINEKHLKTYESLPQAMCESYAVQDTVADYLYENAVIR